MKRITPIFMALAGLLLLAGLYPAFAGEYQNVPYSGSKEFERLKGLSGVWEGKKIKEDKEKTVRIEYRLTGGGSALVETLFPGTPQEMVSVYHDNEGKLEMTHYCMLKNHPRMALEKASDDSLDFTFAGGSDIDPAKDPHMHALTITFLDKDNIIHTWTMFEEGKVKEVATFKLSRSQ